MNDELDTLKRDYSAVEAPPHLATRIKAEVAARPDRNRAWLPAAVTMTVAVALAVPFLSHMTSTKSPPPTRPSLSALTNYTPDKPAVPTPNLAQLRSVRVPRMPPRPRLTTPRPQSSLDTEHENPEEKDHANA